MRTNSGLRPGQVWAPNDPRRWDRFVTITRVAGDLVFVSRRGKKTWMRRSAFFVTGRDGYQRWK